MNQVRIGNNYFTNKELKLKEDFGQSHKITYKGMCTEIQNDCYYSRKSKTKTEFSY
jgi:hypothetical protein